jgi:hypothetical protein
MALPSSGQISLGDVRDEFLGSNPVSIDDYINFRTDGRRVGSDTSLALSDYYDGNDSALLEATMTVGESDYAGTENIYNPPPTSTTQTPIPTTKLRGFDRDIDYLDQVTITAGNNSTTYYQNTDVFGLLSDDTFSSVTVEAIFWSDQFNKVYLIHTGTSDPSFDSLTINGSAYVKGHAQYSTSTSSRNESFTYRVHEWVASNDPFPATDATCTIYITP